jgi:RNA-binding protein
MLSSKQRAFLKKEAHDLSPIVRIGKDGLTDNIAENLMNALNAKELVKVKVLQNLDADKTEVREFGEKLSTETGSELVAVIGRILVFYKENQEKPVVSERLKSIK